MDLYTVLKKHGGKCKDTTVSVDLFQNVSLKGAAAANSCGGSTAVKIGELVLVIDGVSVDLSAVPAAAASNLISPPKTNGSSSRARPPRPASGMGFTSI